jgi:hypothetical protein
MMNVVKGAVNTLIVCWADCPAILEKIALLSREKWQSPDGQRLEASRSPPHRPIVPLCIFHRSSPSAPPWDASVRAAGCLQQRPLSLRCRPTDKCYHSYANSIRVTCQVRPGFVISSPCTALQIEGADGYAVESRTAFSANCPSCG